MKASCNSTAADCGLSEELRRFVEDRRRMFYPKTDLDAPDNWLRQLAGGRAQEVAVAMDEVAAACRCSLGREPISIAPLEHQGTFHRLLRARFADGEEVIVRLNILGHLFRDFQLWTHDWVSRTLPGRGVPCVEVLASDATRRHVPLDFEIVRPAPGRCLRELDCDERAMIEQLRRLGEVVGLLHQVPAAGAGFFDPTPLVRGDADAGISGVLELWSDYVLLNLDRHIAACVDIGVLDTAEARQIEWHFEELEPRLGDVPCRLLHGDLGNHNIFSDGRRITALIDWEDCLCGDPVFDVAFWATFHPPRRHPAFFEGYRRAAEVADDFDVRFWLYFLRIALSKTVHRHRFGYRDLPGRPPASQRIRDALRGLSALQRSRHTPCAGPDGPPTASRCPVPTTMSHEGALA